MTLSRRFVLRGFAGALIALPLLEAGGVARAATTASWGTAPAARRFIALMAPNGVVPAYWFPRGSETQFTLGRHLRLYQPHQAHLLLVKGVDNQAARTFAHKNGHIEGVTSMLSGVAPIAVDPARNMFTGGGITIDQVIARAQREAGYVGKVASLQFNEEGGGGYSSISYADARQPTGIYGPSQAFQLLFSDVSQEREALARAQATRRSILDGTRQDFAALAARVSGEDRLRIEAHLEAVRDIEQRLALLTQCEAPALDLNPENDDEVRTLYYDLLVAAMSCDATRVAAVSFRHSGGGGPSLPFAGVYEDIHELSHHLVGEPQGGPAHLKFDAYHQWFAGKVVRMVERLEAVKLPDGSSLFDETVILQGSDISFDHDTPDMPFMLLAGRRTPFHTGRHVTFDPPVPHNHLLVTLLNAFGVDVDRFGDPRFGVGNLNARLLKA